MQRDNIVVEIQRRVNLIKIANGYTFDVRYVFRNPEGEPSPDIMPMCNIFEFPSTTTSSSPSRGAKSMPIYKQFFRVVVEMWYLSSSQGETSRDVMTFLKYVRQVLFSDGQTLGGKASMVAEEEVSRVYRPPVDKKAVGIGVVLGIQFLEDFNNL